MTALFRPKPTGNGSAYLGFQGARIIGFEDRASTYDWADIYLVAHLDLERCQYPLELRLMGNLEYTPGGDILIENSLVRQLYFLFDALGWTGGLNEEGQFCTTDGALIDDLVQYLTDHFLPDFPQQVKQVNSPAYPYLVYVYRQWNPKQQKAYLQVARKIVRNTDAGHTDLNRYIAYLKERGYINEYEENQTNTQSGNGHASLIRL